MKFAYIALIACATAIKIKSKDEDGFKVEMLKEGSGEKVPEGAEVTM